MSFGSGIGKAGYLRRHGASSRGADPAFNHLDNSWKSLAILGQGRGHAVTEVAEIGRGKPRQLHS